MEGGAKLEHFIEKLRSFYSINIFLRATLVVGHTKICLASLT